MNRETKRPRITRPIENRDENRRGRTPRFENREGGESVSTRTDRDGNKDTGISVI